MLSGSLLKDFRSIILSSLIALIVGCTVVATPPPPVVIKPEPPPGHVIAAENHVRNGKKHLAKGKCHQAIKEFEKAIDKDPRNPETHYWLGVAYHECGYYDRAIAVWRISIELRPKDVVWVSRVRTSIGFALELKGDYEGASAEYRFALKLDSKNAIARASLDDIERGRPEMDKNGLGKKGKGPGKAHEKGGHQKEKRDYLFKGLEN